MRKSDINSMADIFQRMLTESAAAGGITPAPSNGGNLYSFGPEKLRENNYTSDSGEPIVLFYTKKISDTENDVLHRSDGPAVIFGEGGEGNEFFFLNGEKVDPASKEWKAAGHEMKYRGHEQEFTGETDADDLGAFN